MTHRLTPNLEDQELFFVWPLPLTNLAWLDLPGTKVPAGTALRIIEALKPHHHYKVTAHE